MKEDNKCGTCYFLENAWCIYHDIPCDAVVTPDWAVDKAQKCKNWKKYPDTVWELKDFR